jgi:hypothetical protein
MHTFITTVTTNWHVIRVVRLLAAIAMLAWFLNTGEKTGLLGAAFFGYQAVFNAGCGAACYTPPVRNAKTAGQIEYEEIKTPKP